MSKATVLVITAICLSFALTAIAQEPDYSQLPGRPYAAGEDPDIDRFISSWEESMPESHYGQLVERSMFSKSAGDPMNPHTRGAVLTYLNRFTHATLNVGASTTPSKLSGEQVVFFIDGGVGTITSGRKTVELYSGVGILMPPDIEFTMTNTGDEPLTMYVFAEPIPDDFKPKKAMVVRDTNNTPIAGTTGHWSHIFTPLFSPADGTALLDMGPVWYDSMTMGQPHSHNPGFEEVWTALDGDINILLGKRMRHLPVGSAYKVPPDYMSAHSNINAGDKPIRLMWFIVRTVPEPPAPSQSMLAPRPFDPDVDPNIDMYIGNWRDSQPRHSHGSLIEREVLSKCDGDPMNPPRKGAVLKYVNRFVHATLMGKNSTLPITPKNEQELFYILSGNGVLESGGASYELYSGMTFMIPEGVEFSMTNTSSEPMTMYLVAEPTPDGFIPRKKVVVRDENVEPYHTSDAHWVNTNKWLIEEKEGLADLELFITVTIMPGNFAQPHPHDEGVEEVWCTISGDVKFLLGKQIRDLPVGSAYLIPPDNKTPHANFNVSDEPIKFFYFARGWNRPK